MEIYCVGGAVRDDDAASRAADAGVDAAPALELDVHRAGNPWIAVAGWGLMALVMLALATRRTTEAA